MAKQTVLITGASGFVAAHVIQAFLEAGYNIRATVRDEKKAQQTGANYQSYVDSGALTFAIVKDIGVAGAFDEAVKGVDGVIHTASPFVLQVEDNERDLLKPAVNGTLNALRSIQKNAPGVKRVVITSSFASIVDLSKGNRAGYTYSEKDWNPATWEECVKNDNGSFVYCASKVLAEKAAAEFEKGSEGSVNFTVSTVCPPMVYGPAKQYISDLNHLNSSTSDIYRFFNGQSEKVGPNAFWGFVDVRDLAQAHLKAYELEESGRFLITAGNYTYQEVVNVLRKVPGIEQSRIAKDDETLEWPEVYKYDNSKSIEKLGMTYRTIEESITDTANQLLELEKTLGKSGESPRK